MLNGFWKIRCPAFLLNFSPLLRCPGRPRRWVGLAGPRGCRKPCQPDRAPPAILRAIALLLSGDPGASIPHTQGCFLPAPSEPCVLRHSCLQTEGFFQQRDRPCSVPSCVSVKQKPCHFATSAGLSGWQDTAMRQARAHSCRR